MVPGQRGAGAFLDDLGMLMTPAYLIGQPNGLVEVEALTGGDSLCLLGEAGAGKTTALETIADRVPAGNAGGQGTVVFVSMAEVTEASVFRDLVIAPAAGAAGAGDRVTLVLDGLDECPVGSGKAIVGLLRLLLREVDASAMRLLVGCRSADYPPAVDEVLTAAFPGFARYELAPLRRRDVEELAASRGVPAEDFLSEVTRTGAGPLASFPLTLDLLLRRYEVGTGLPGTAAEVYEGALLTLADEHDTDRDPALAPAASQVLAVAAKLCCYQLVCGRAGFWTGPAALKPSGDTDPGALAAGQERLAGGTFDVTRPLVTATLNSALFTSGGPQRRVPAHARFAAYLAARHLADRQLPAAQLRSLLTATVDSGTGVIPALRETAAWLLALQPRDTAWAEDADLTVLTAYGALIAAPELRAALAERILASPRRFTGLGWQRGWTLTHPGLGGQLTPVLTALADASAPEPGPEQAYIALMLARQAAPASVITPVLAAAARQDLDYGLRAVAARTAAALDHDAAVPVLAGVLGEAGDHPDHDPDDEFRGIALSVLWPAHLTAAELAASLTTPRRTNLLGAYLIFRGKLPGQLTDDDVPPVLEGLLAASPAEPGTAVPAGAGWLSRDDGDLAEALLDRAFDCQDAGTVIGPAAALAARCLQDNRTPALPAALDDRDSAGDLTGQARGLRRLLAARLVSDHGDGLAAHQIILGWQPSRAAQERDAEAARCGQRPALPPRLGLLGPEDLQWALETAAAAGPGQAGTWTAVLRSIWDPMDPGAQAAAWQARDTPLWAAFSGSFDPVVLGSDAETVERRRFAAMRPRPAGWAGAEAHAAEVLSLYQRAAADPAAFPGLVYALQTDPVDGGLVPVADDDLASRPGTALLPAGWEPYLRQAARHYLDQGPPPGPGVLDTPARLPLTALAGYLALAFLVRHPASGGAQLPPDDVLARWAPSVLVTGIGESSLHGTGPGPRQVLLGRLAGSAQAGLPALAGRLIEALLAGRTWPALLEPLDAAYSDDLAATLTRCLGSASAALGSFLADGAPAGQHGQQRHEEQLGSLRRTVTVLAEILARHGHGPGITAAEALVAEAAAPDAGEASLQAGRGAALGLAAGDPGRWTSLAGQLSAAPALQRGALRDLARDPAQLTGHLSEDDLGELWELLNRYWPAQVGGPSLVSGFVGPDEQARHWRDGVLGELTRRGTADAVRVLRQLAASHPDIPSLQDLTWEADELRLGQDWSPVREQDLTRLFEDSTKRLVRSGSDLADLVHQAILEAAGSLSKTGQLLWNTRTVDKRELWRPKSEVAFGAWLADQLSVRLERAGVIINREVRVRETTTQHGQAVDIQADAPLTGARQDEPTVCRIELKGNWHDELTTAMRTQLADDYLILAKLRHGIYVTAWFDTTMWNDAEARRGKARSRNQGETTAELDSQALELRALGLDVRSVVVYIPRPVKSTRAAKPAKGTARGRVRAARGTPPA